MAIAATVSSTELRSQVLARFEDKFLEARLINAPGVTYTANVTDDSAFLAQEVVAGTGGYERVVIKYETSDVTPYNDDGVALATKATTFAHDGSGTILTFSHAALVWSQGNALTLGGVGTAPTAGVDGTYTNIPIDSTSGSGVGLRVDLTIQNSGATPSDYILTIARHGYDYAPAEVVSISDGTLAGLGAITSGAGSLGFSVATTTTNPDAGDVLAVAKTTSTVNLASGNEAVFYWNLKQFGISQV